MARPNGQTRRDLIMWGTGLVIAAVATAVATAAGARLGAALTGGVILLIALVLTALAMEGRRGD